MCCRSNYILLCLLISNTYYQCIRMHSRLRRRLRYYVILIVCAHPYVQRRNGWVSRRSIYTYIMYTIYIYIVYVYKYNILWNVIIMSRLRGRYSRQMTQGFSSRARVLGNGFILTQQWCDKQFVIARRLRLRTSVTTTTTTTTTTTRSCIIILLLLYYVLLCAY